MKTGYTGFGNKLLNLAHDRWNGETFTQRITEGKYFMKRNKKNSDFFSKKTLQIPNSPVFQL